MSDIDASVQGHFCDIDQYAMLLRCSKKNDMTEWNEWWDANQDVEIWLQGADFSEAYLQEAYFRAAHCEGADFSHAHCEGAFFGEADCARADFIGAHCEGAFFTGARCEGVDFFEADCEGANFNSAHCEGAEFKSAHCEGAEFNSAHCERAHFWVAHCEGAVFSDAHCEGTHFWKARCEGANFSGAHCEGADFKSAHCDGALFNSAHCEGADFRFAQFSPSTRFFDCTIDDASDFSCTAVESIMVEPSKRARMEYNIRRFAWKKRYEEQVEPLRRVFQINGLQTVGKILYPLLAWCYLFPVRFFWHVSDYGYSTGRVIKYFIFFIMLFALLYTVFSWMLMLNNTPIDVPFPERFLQMLAFATSTMVTLGFSNINVAIENGKPVLAGMLAVSCNLIVGYFMLAVLVTRLAILFQSMGPGEPRNKKIKVEEQ